jgi:hypothetical protein
MSAWAVDVPTYSTERIIHERDTLYPLQELSHATVL